MTTADPTPTKTDTTQQVSTPPPELPDARPEARKLAIRFAAVGVLVVGVVDILDAQRAQWVLASQRKEEFELFAAYFVAASGIERSVEIVSAWFPTKKERPPADQKELAAFRAQRKADRGVITAGLAAMLGMVVSAATGLYFLRAVGASPPWWLDMTLTGALLSGGTKTVHELLRVVEKARKPDPPSPSTPTGGDRPASRPSSE